MQVYLIKLSGTSIKIKSQITRVTHKEISGENKRSKLQGIIILGIQQSISLEQSITKGFISAKRTIKNKVYIQCDVNIVDSNSGGAMTNKDGELIGILNAKLVSNSIDKVSLAIPSFYIEEFLKVKIGK